MPSTDPPVDDAYQFKVPELEVAPSVTEPASQREPGVVVKTVGVEFTVAVTGVLDEVQLFETAST